MEALGRRFPKLSSLVFLTSLITREGLHIMVGSISASLSSDRALQLFSKSLELLPFSHHASINRSGNLIKSSVNIPDKDKKILGKTFYSTEACTSDENVVGNSSTTAQEKVGVLLPNLGGPDTLQDVQPFLLNLFADPDIIRLPRLFQFLQRPLAKLISVVRAPKSKEGYAAIGGGSPLRKITYEQIKRDKIAKLVVLPLHPQYSISTSGSSIRLLQTIFREDAYFEGLPISIIESWYQREGYIKSMADLVEKEILSFSKPAEVMIFFSAHGVPVSYVEDAGDPYRDQMEDCISLIMNELKSRGITNQHTLAYQSRLGPVQWLKPYTDEVLVELGQKGVKSLLAVPIRYGCGSSTDRRLC